jgi:hypothetical protein
MAVAQSQYGAGRADPGGAHYRRPVRAEPALGALRFAVLTVSGTLTAAGFIAFLQRLWHDAERTGVGPVFCVVDNHPAHRAKAVLRERAVPQ